MQQPNEQAAELERLRTENGRMRHELEVMYGGAYDSPKPQPADQAVEAHRLALSEAVGLGTGAPWDAIRERVGELQGDLAKLVRWRKEDGAALAEMRRTIERLQQANNDLAGAAITDAAPADRAIVLREEAAHIRAHCPDHLDSDSSPGAWMVCHCDVADDIDRRTAANEAPAVPALSLDGALRIVADWHRHANEYGGTDADALAVSLARAGYALPDGAAQVAPQPEPQADLAALPLLFWDEPDGVTHEDGRITAWLSRAANLAQTAPAGRLILRTEAAKALRRALTTALNDADEAQQTEAGR
ncbi:hypothetical protein AB0M68_03795 [Streptomyces sp. NPDC051453]|uniref:hypothetical protein n=1 Tax=Streptomyces sp. NPDC051453 TaxID=3154941 RepID=UPI003422B727